MGAGRGKNRRIRAATTAVVTAKPKTSLSPDVQALYDRAITLNKNSTLEEEVEVHAWAQEYSRSGDLRYGAAVAIYALSGYAEQKGRRVNRRTPDKQRALLQSRAQTSPAWKNYGDIRYDAEYEAMRYLADNFPETEIKMNSFDESEYTRMLEFLKEKTSKGSFKRWPAHFIPEQNDDPIVKFLNESYTEGMSANQGIATFVPDEEFLAAAPIVVTESVVKKNINVPYMLLHESTHIAHGHTTRSGNLGGHTIEGTTDALSLLAMERDEQFFNLDEDIIGYANEMKLALAVVLTQECEDRDSLIKSISALSQAAGERRNISNKEDKAVLDNFTGLPSGKINWVQFYKKTVCDPGLGVDELRDKIVAADPGIFAARKLSKIADVTLSRS